MRLLNSLSKVNNWTEFTLSQREYSKKDQGTRFELLTKELFRLDPLYTSWIRNVWLSSELPVRVQKILNLKSDIGFDLILEDNDGRLIPVQCKYHSDPSRNVGWKEASTFVGLYNDKKFCQEAFLCSNAFGVSKNFDSLEGKPINRILGSQWSKLDASFFGNIRNRASKDLVPYRPLKHQEKAIQDAKSYFLKNGNTRGKLIFPCGSGKSLTGFWFTQHLNAQTTLIAVPSLALIKQTLEVYFREIVAQNLNVKWLCVCSDSDIGSGVSEIKFSTSDIGIPSTTDPVKIKNWLKITKGDKRYVFTTYQSGQRLGEICKETGTQFDLGIFDEAHKTVGAKDKLFSHLLFHQNIKIDRRIFMTATERFYTGSKDDIASMDNAEIYGEVFSKMSFKDAITTKLLTDYKIITIDVAKQEIASFIRKNKLVELSPKYGKEAEARSLASMLALRKAMQKLPIKNAVSFHSSIDKARHAESIQALLSEEFGFDEIDTYTVNGKDSVGKRERIINEFANSDNALITNARCLTEGVDVPKIDCIVFSDPKRSKVDIVQALGRALRKKEGKEWGYVILPVVYDEKTHEIDNNSFKDILGIIRGLAANDERIIEYFKEIEKDEVYISDKNELLNFSSSLSEKLDQNTISELGIRIWEGLSNFEWKSYQEASLWAQSKNIKSRSEWFKLVVQEGTAFGIPHSPRSAYHADWTGWGDFLGTDRVAPRNMTFVTYEDARDYAKSLGLRKQGDWFKHVRESSIPMGIPLAPYSTYKNKGWNGWGDFLGTGNIANFNRKYYPFNEARSRIHLLNIKTKDEYKGLKRAGDISEMFPSNPNRNYQDDGWNGWGDFLGTQRVASFNQIILPYPEARKFARSLNLNSWTEWRNYVKKNQLPRGIPNTPHNVYKDQGWLHIGDWLGIEGYRPRQQQGDWRSFKSARDFVHSLNLQSSNDWKKFAKSSELPLDIPKSPQTVYAEKGFISLQDWIGVEKQNWRDFAAARNYVRSLGLKNLSEWREFCKSGNRPRDIPSNPNAVYEQYTSAGDWLGTGTVRTDLRVYRKYDEAKQFVHELDLKSQEEWNQWTKSGKKPEDIPTSPYRVYQNNGWVSWFDWLGKEKKQT